MKLTITQEDNDLSNHIVKHLHHNITLCCPTAIAVCRQTGRNLGTVGVSYSSIFLTSNAKSEYLMPHDLEDEIKRWTEPKNRGTPIIGDFELSEIP